MGRNIEMKNFLNLLFCLLFSLQTIIPVYAGSITPDKKFAKKPSIITAPNNVPIQNIVTPNSSGLSHNRFTNLMWINVA